MQTSEIILRYVSRKRKPYTIQELVAELSIKNSTAAYAVTQLIKAKLMCHDGNYSYIKRGGKRPHYTLTQLARSRVERGVYDTRVRHESALVGAAKEFCLITINRRGDYG